MLRILMQYTVIGILAASLSQAACSGERTKLITAEMRWHRGGIRAADRVSLHFKKGSVDCSLNFFQSEELEKYIESFGSATVPVVFNVSYDQGGKPLGALLVTVGEWEASKLQPNERLLSTTQKVDHPERGRTKILKIDSPGACFDPI